MSYPTATCAECGTNDHDLRTMVEGVKIDDGHSERYYCRDDFARLYIGGASVQSSLSDTVTSGAWKDAMDNLASASDPRDEATYIKKQTENLTPEQAAFLDAIKGTVTVLAAAPESCPSR